MAKGSESEVRGLHTIGNPEVETRSADGGPTGETSIGSRVWGTVMARGNADKVRNDITIYRSNSKLRGTGR